MTRILKAWWLSRTPAARFRWVAVAVLLWLFIGSRLATSPSTVADTSAGTDRTVATLAAAVPPTAATTDAPTTPPTPAPTRTPDHPSIGDQGRIHIDGVDTIIIASTQKDLDALRKAFAAHDSVGAQQLALQGGAFLVANDTKILVIDRQGFFVQSVQVRILSGPMTNRAGWTEPDWVVR